MALIVKYILISKMSNYENMSVLELKKYNFISLGVNYDKILYRKTDALTYQLKNKQLIVRTCLRKKLFFTD